MLRPARIITLPTYLSCLGFPSSSLKVIFEDALETIEATEEAIDEPSVEPGETVEEAIEDFLADS